MALTQKHAEDVCLVYAGHKACRYLIYDSQGNKYLCSKLCPSMKGNIDKRVSEFIKKAKQNSQDLAALGRAVGDNCQGYLFLKYKKQGYDVKN